jgi:hypothetical protein
MHYWSPVIIARTTIAFMAFFDAGFFGNFA